MNPSKRYPGSKEELEQVQEAIRISGIKWTNEEEKIAMVRIMILIKKKLFEDPSFAKRLRQELGF